MQLKKQVNNKIRKILKNSKWIQIPNFNPLCGVGEGVFPSSIVLSCQALRGISQLIEGVKRPPSQLTPKRLFLCHVERSETSPPFLFSGGVRGGSVHLLDSRRRPLTAFGVTHNGKGTPLPN